MIESCGGSARARGRRSGREFDGVFVAENADGLLELIDFERLF